MARRKSRPRVTLKAAITLDGRIATRNGDSKWISNAAARRQAHRLRAQHDAVLVGVGTVIKDDPQLTVRDARGANPTRIVLDRRLRTPPTAQVLSSAAPTWLVCGPQAGRARRKALEQAGARILQVPAGALGVDWQHALACLAGQGVETLLVEGGARIHGTLLTDRLADEAAIFIAPRILGDPSATPLARGPAVARLADGHALHNVQVRRFGDNVLMRGSFRA